MWSVKTKVKNKKEWSYMTKKLSFLPKIDRTATEEKLEGVLESVRIYRQFGMIRKEMKATPSYEIREHGQHMLSESF